MSKLAVVALQRLDLSRIFQGAFRLAGIGAAYFLLAKLGLQLASIHPSASPIWPPTGFALAALLLWGQKVWPAILIGAFLANVTTSGTLLTSSAIAVGNTLEALIGAFLVNVWAGGIRSFDTPAGVAKFALVSVIVSTPISATIGVGSLALGGLADPASLSVVWLTWWLGDLTGALLVAPVVVLWLAGEQPAFGRERLLNAGVAFAGAVAVGLIAFSPLLEQTPIRGPLGFLAVVPLVWAALTCGPRETATVAFALSCFAVWGNLSRSGPFAQDDINASFLLLLMFMISTSVPSLVLSADAAMRRAAQAELMQNEQSLRAMFNQALVGIAQCAATGRIEFANQKFCELTQQSSAELSRKTLQDLSAESDVPHVSKGIARVAAGEDGVVIENRYVRPDGSQVWVRNFVSGVSDDERRGRHLLVFSDDVTERKDADERQRLLMAELDHRVRNILASVQSMVRLTAHRARTKEEYASALEGRIAAMARTHGLLTRERWAGANLRQILSDELAPYEGRAGALTLDGAADYILPPKEALDFALLVHELATNAAKHGAFSRSSGRVAARWHIEPSDDGVSRLVFDWVESGGPPVERMQGRGFGLSLIESTFGAIPERSVELRFEPDGVRCTISMTLPGTTRLPRQA